MGQANVKEMMLILLQIAFHTELSWKRIKSKIKKKREIKKKDKGKSCQGNLKNKIEFMMSLRFVGVRVVVLRGNVHWFVVERISKRRFLNAKKI